MSVKVGDKVHIDIGYGLQENWVNGVVTDVSQGQNLFDSGTHPVIQVKAGGSLYHGIVRWIDGWMKEEHEL